MAKQDAPVWKFDKVEIIGLESMDQKFDKVPPEQKELRSHTHCLAIIDFGFFICYDIGLSFENGSLTWSNYFGWGKFKFRDSRITNPNYYKEVEKVEILVKEELDRKRCQIISFLKSNDYHLYTFEEVE